jgi:glycosyltransferase involved in cell wall biosynthesis
MRIGLVNLVTKSSEILSEPTAMVKASDLAPTSDAGLNIVEIGRRIASRGHEVRIFVADVFRPKSPMPGEGRLRIKYVPTRLTRAFPPSLAPLTPSLGRCLKEERLDVVQSGELFQPGTALSWLGSSSSDVSLFVWQEIDVLMRSPLGYAQSAYYRTLGKAIVNRCSSLIPRSVSARNHLIQHGVREDRISSVVHSGVDTRTFRPLDKDECMVKFGIDGKEAVILTAARLDPIKGLDLLIRAMTKVSSELPRSILVIQGNGPAYPELKRLADSLDLGDHVRFITESFPHSEMPPLYNIADVFAITSRIDLFPFVAIEAISCGVPLATSFSRGLKTDIVDRGGGVMLPQEPEAMGNAFVSLLEDRDRLTQIGHRCRRLAEEDFEFEVCADRFLQIYGRAQ